MTIRGTILPQGRTQFFGNDGEVLAGGSVGYYIPATLTGKATYQDDAFAVPNTNPVGLDDSGSALIWGSGEYRMIVKNAAGSTIFDGITYAPPAGGTGSGFGQQTALASAANCDLGTIATHNVLITGATPITSFGSSADISAPLYLVTFQNAIQVTYNAASLIIPTGANYNFLAGDAVLMEYLGGGNWQMLELILGVTGTGGKAVLSIAPTLVAPNIGAATASSLHMVSGQTASVAPATPTTLFVLTLAPNTAKAIMVFATCSGATSGAFAIIDLGGGVITFQGNTGAGNLVTFSIVGTTTVKGSHSYGADSVINWNYLLFN